MPMLSPASRCRSVTRLLLATVFWICLALPAAAEPVPDHLRAWQQAQALLDAGNAADALSALEDAHRLAPDEPLYTYHLGHLQERLGHNAAALASLKSVLGHPSLDPELRDLAATRVAALEPLADKAVLRVRAIPRDQRVQVDGLALWETRPDVPLTPGLHLVCVISAESDAARCWHTDMAAGRRLDWPPRDLGGPRAVLRWPRDRAASQLYLDDFPLSADLSRLETVEVDAGSVRGSIGYAQGNDRFQLSVEDGQIVDIPTREAARVAAQTSPAGAAVDGGIYERSRPRGRSVGPVPWIVAGTGVAAAVVGAVFLAGGASDRQAITDGQAVPPGGGLPLSSITYADASKRWDAANSKTTVGAALVGAGAAVAVGGVLWWVIAKTTGGGEAPVGASVWTEPGAAGVTWRGTFQ
jgi:hypothetical protein